MRTYLVLFRDTVTGCDYYRDGQPNEPHLQRVPGHGYCSHSYRCTAWEPVVLTSVMCIANITTRRTAAPACTESSIASTL